jgi:hypothetical protein
MKIPLATSLKNRDATTNKDARIVNGYVEIKGDLKKGGSARVYKRPGLTSAFEVIAGGGGGQGLYVPTIPDGEGDGVPGVIIGDILTRDPTPITKNLFFSVQPVNWILTSAMSPAVVVKAYTAFGTAVIGYTGDVTVSLSTNPTGATLGGTVTVTAVAGVATFSNLTMDRSGEGFRMIATALGLTSVPSDAFNIPTECAFTTQPASGQPNVTLDAVVVTIQDAVGTTDTNYSGAITLALYSNSAGGTLSGTLTVNAVSGVATFSNLQIDTNGTYTLKASAAADSGNDAYTPGPKVSDSFAIAEYILTAVAGGPGEFGFFFGGPGSISPTTLNGQTIQAWFSSPADGTWFRTTGTDPALFTSVTANGITLLSADATFSGNSWNWPLTNMFTAAGTYGATFT